jgi:ABC-2 type transport system ATP-binding protein
MLEAIQLTKTFGDAVALDSLNLKIEPGEIFCLLGANGAGKTTTINLFLDFLKPTGGKALVNGLNVAEHGLETKKYLAYIPEQVTLYRNFTGVENLEFFSDLAGSRRTRAELREILFEVGLSKESLDRKVATYSKGMRQKVGIAIAVAKDAKALLLDEPTSGLDPRASNEFSELLKKLGRQGVAVLMATHDLFRAKEAGTRIGVMRGGELVATFLTDEVSHADLEERYLEYMKG